MKALFLACAFAYTCTANLMSATVSAPSGEWTALLGNFDFLEDQQTGLSEGDIVGMGEDYGFFVTYNSAKADVYGQATFGFRLRFDAAAGIPKTSISTARHGLGSMPTAMVPSMSLSE